MISPPRALTFAAVLAAAALACNDITRPIAVAPNASRSFLTSPGGDVVVSPDSMEGWAFSDDRTDAACSWQDRPREPSADWPDVPVAAPAACTASEGRVEPLRVR